MTEKKNERKTRNLLRYSRLVAVLGSLVLFSIVYNGKAAVGGAQYLKEVERYLAMESIERLFELGTWNESDAIANSTSNTLVQDDASLIDSEATKDQTRVEHFIAGEERMDVLTSNDSNTEEEVGTAPKSNQTSSGSDRQAMPKHAREYFQKFPPCQVRVSNRKDAHYEVIESIAKLIPYQYLGLGDDRNCNHYHLNFEFDCIGGMVRAKTWAKDMNERLAGTSMLDKTGIQRSFGPALIKRKKPNRNSWDAIVQVSCQCNVETHQWLLEGNQTSKGPAHVCIHHGKCNLTASLPNAVQMSPHHERYFVPSALPQFDDPPPFQKDDRLEICAIGSIRRRKWRLLLPFWDNPDNKKYWNTIRIRMMGKGKVPKYLRPYLNRTKIISQQIAQERMYYAAEKACDMIILPIAKDEGSGYMHYFKNMNGSTWKLSGTIPPIIAFERPFLIPKELIELYQKELPLHVPHRGFEGDDFVEAFCSLIEELVSSK